MIILRYGSTGPYVELLQLALKRSGYYNGSLDGIFGDELRSSLIRFQSDFGLSAVGISGQKTWEALGRFLRGYFTRQVRSGDTLYRLANSFGSTIVAIEAANPGIDPLSLTVGSTLIIPFGFDVVPTNIHFTYALLQYCVAGLTARYPFISRGSLGISAMGKELYWLSAGQGANHVFYNASHHANEWITTPLVLRFLEQYAKSYINEGSIFGIPALELMEQSMLHLAPMVNPDGVDLATGALTMSSDPACYSRAQSIALDYPAIAFPDGWKANIEGVDLNLQYPAGWELAKEIKFAQGFTSPAPRDYVGASALSASESRAVYNYTRQHDFALTLSYHTQGKIIFWRYLDYEPPRAYEIARRFAAVSGYDVGDPEEASSHAGYKDWFLQDFGRPGYTIEAGAGISPLPISQFDEIYRDNLGILVNGLTATL